MRRVHQLLASFRAGDAISNEALVIQRLLRGWGYESEIFAETQAVESGARQTVHDLRALGEVGDDCVILHLSSGSRVNMVFKELPCRRVIIYHNITPPEYFQGIQEQVAMAMRRGREQMAQLAGVADLVLADSAFNAAELEACGYSDVRVMPLLLDFDLIKAKPDRRILSKFDDGRINLLFVGRCVPNKRIEDVIAALYYLRNYVDPEARLIHAGSAVGMEQYHALLITHVRSLGLGGVELLGGVSQEELSACYQVASAFICMSEHEGFCIPLLEAMAHDLPIIAYAAGAVPETLGGAGVLCRDKQFDAIAELAADLSREGELRTAVIERQRARLAEYRGRDLESEFRRHVASVLEID